VKFHSPILTGCTVRSRGPESSNVNTPVEALPA
jgi:hypothetical protein